MQIEQRIKKELEENPALEEGEDGEAVVGGAGDRGIKGGARDPEEGAVGQHLGGCARLLAGRGRGDARRDVVPVRDRQGLGHVQGARASRPAGQGRFTLPSSLKSCDFRHLL